MEILTQCNARRYGERKLKYLVIDNLKESQDKFATDNLVVDLKKVNNQLTKIEFKNQSLKLSVNLYKDSLSKIKSRYNNDTLSVVIHGIKIISIFDLHEKKRKISLNVLKGI